ncbi:NADH dehydrogenase (ubiquinone) complex I, assembly factor 6-like [Dysidea avara]|uniref:NADH dehydrogenase (ubiquinone) complex I, assembly factor 6-like n=1 Tax=Dysidea avara TaxID=196820 RepID=UPI00332250CD
MRLLSRYCFPSKSNATPMSYCVELVRKHDYEHYLCGLLTPGGVRDTVFALRAFNVETSQIRDSVTEKHIGKMRLQFWRDTIDSIFKNGSPPEHPVAMALAHVTKHRKLSKLWFTRLLNAREHNLEDHPFHYTREIEEYAENTNGALLYLTLECFGVQDVTADHAASHLGKAETIVTLLRAASYYRSCRRVCIPMDVLMRHGASQEDFVRGELTPALKEATFDFASLANTHLLKAQSLRGQIPSNSIPAFLPAVACESFLARIRKLDFNLFDPRLTTRNSLLPLTLLRKSWMRKF